MTEKLKGLPIPPECQEFNRGMMLDFFLSNNPDNQLPPAWHDEFTLKELEKLDIKLNKIILTSTPYGNKGFFWDIWSKNYD